MAKQHNNEQLFDEASNGGVGALTALVFVLGMALVIGGSVLLSYVFSWDANIPLGFTGGFLMITIGFFLPFTALPASGK